VCFLKPASSVRSVDDGFRKLYRPHRRTLMRRGAHLVFRILYANSRVLFFCFCFCFVFGFQAGARVLQYWDSRPSGCLERRGDYSTADRERWVVGVVMGTTNPYVYLAHSGESRLYTDSLFFVCSLYLF
jgi:hypothetical protein